LSGHGIYAAAELYPKYIDKIDSLPKRTVSIKKRYKREYLYGTETVHLDRERPVRLKTREMGREMGQVLYGKWDGKWDRYFIDITLLNIYIAL
jgi:hypothetical protein